MTHVADIFEGFLAHRRVDGDAENNAIVDAFVGALGDVFERLGLIAFGEGGVDGVRFLNDPSVAKDWALAHAALYTGARLPGRMLGETPEAYLQRARDAAVYPEGIKRGTHEAIRRAVQPFLTGGKSVFINDDFGGPYDVFVRTLTDETPDPDVVRAHLEGSFVSGGQRGAIRAELALTYLTANQAAWAEGTLAWSAVPATATWENVTLEDVT